MNLLGLTPLDVIAAIWFVVCWIGYSVFSGWNGHRTASLLRTLLALMENAGEATGKN